MPSVEEQLTQLKKRFRLRLEKTQSGFEHWQQAPAPFEEIHGVIHQLAGTAGTYGYTQLSEQLKEIDQGLYANSLTLKDAIVAASTALEDALKTIP